MAASSSFYCSVSLPDCLAFFFNCVYLCQQGGRNEQSSDLLCKKRAEQPKCSLLLFRSSTLSSPTLYPSTATLRSNTKRCYAPKTIQQNIIQHNTVKHNHIQRILYNTRSYNAILFITTPYTQYYKTNTIHYTKTFHENQNKTNPNTTEKTQYNNKTQRKIIYQSTTQNNKTLQTQRVQCNEEHQNI